jgi:hypothetical protein
LHVRAVASDLDPARVLGTVTPLAMPSDSVIDFEAECANCRFEGFDIFTPRGIPDDGMPQPDPAISADASAKAEQFLTSIGFMTDDPRK